MNGIPLLVQGFFFTFGGLFLMMLNSANEPPDTMFNMAAGFFSMLGIISGFCGITCLTLHRRIKTLESKLEALQSSLAKSVPTAGNE
jgi:hypothetical protein